MAAKRTSKKRSSSKATKPGHLVHVLNRTGRTIRVIDLPDEPPDSIQAGDMINFPRPDGRPGVTWYFCFQKQYFWDGQGEWGTSLQAFPVSDPADEAAIARQRRRLLKRFGHL